MSFHVQLWLLWWGPENLLVHQNVGSGKPLAAPEADVHQGASWPAPAGCSPHAPVPACPSGLAPSLGIDDNGPRLVAVPAEHHAHGVPIQSVDVDGVGGLARPEQRPAVDVDAEVMRLPVWVLVLAQGGQNERL